jgi:hypothetical protein
VGNWERWVVGDLRASFKTLQRLESPTPQPPICITSLAPSSKLLNNPNPKPLNSPTFRSLSITMQVPHFSPVRHSVSISLDAILSHWLGHGPERPNTAEPPPREKRMRAQPWTGTEPGLVPADQAENAGTPSSQASGECRKPGDVGKHTETGQAGQHGGKPPSQASRPSAECRETVRLSQPSQPTERRMQGNRPAKPAKQAFRADNAGKPSSEASRPGGE